jgi:hypothetical protein
MRYSTSDNGVSQRSESTFLSVYSADVQLRDANCLRCHTVVAML